MYISVKRHTVVCGLVGWIGAEVTFAQKGDIALSPTGEITQPAITELWRQPKDIPSENLFYGRGGKEHEPHGPFTFVDEDLDGTNPKFNVRDQDGVKWKIKLGAEARPETVASRFVWAIGYHSDQDYFLAEAQVSGLPAHVHRGQDLIDPGGVMRNVRVKREELGKKVGSWSWRDNPFAGTRELDGLRVMMAVINNWDLKDENNAIRDFKSGDEDGDTREYYVSDLGASFGTTGRELSHTKSKGNLTSYARSTFITKTGATTVSFDLPSRPPMIIAFNPHEYTSRTHMRWIGENIPRESARWIGELLGQLSQDQVRDAFRSAGYEGLDVAEFAVEFQKRIDALKGL
jgi:hypothetical protein